MNIILFYRISTLVGYTITNPIYTYIREMTWNRIVGTQIKDSKES